MIQPTPRTSAGQEQPSPPADGATSITTPPVPTPAPASMEYRTPDHVSSGSPIQCQYCVGQRFRRSRLRFSDIKQLLLMRYPVRCLYCSQRQMVSFTVAGVSLPSHVSQPKKRRRGSPH